MDSRPNVLLVVLDTVRASRVSCYGYQKTTTPNLDALAEEGTRYRYVFSEGCWTVPSHASMFTGEPSTVHGSNAYNRSFDPEDGTALAEVLREHGYRTAGASRNAWVTSDRGFDRGFDRFDDRDHAQLFEEEFDIRSAIRRHAGTDTPRRYVDMLHDALTSGSPFKAVTNLVHFLYRDSAYCDDGGSVNNAFAKDILKNADEPWFLFLNYMEAHEPYYKKRAHDTNFLPEESVVRETFDEAAKWDYHAGRTQPPFETLKALYDAEIRLADRYLGRVLDRLRESGQLEETLVVVVGDHGQHFGEHGLMAHIASPYPQAVRVPLVVSEPGQSESSVVTTPISLRSIYGTILETALGDDAPTENVTDAPVISHCFGSHEQVFDEYPELDRDKWNEHLATLFFETDEGVFGFIKGEHGRGELYDVDDSMGTSLDETVADTIAVESLEQELETMSDHRTTADDRTVSARLRDLGYK